MDVSDYLPMFLAEGREHLQELNLSLVRIEQNPQDGETINEIFRAAHTLKGMSATMGFSAMASLTHEMESVMEALRTRPEGLGRSALDTLFACLDTLEGIVLEIEETGSESSDVAPLVAVLGALRSEDGAAPAPAPASMPAVSAGLELPPVQVTITLADDTDMPGVRAYVAVRAAEEHGDIVSCEPPFDVIETGELEGLIVSLVLASTASPDEIAASVRGIECVAGCTAVVAGEEPVEAQLVPAPVAAAIAETPAATEAPVAAKPKSQTVRIEADRLDLLMHLMGEMVVQRTRVQAAAAGSASAELHAAINDLTRSSAAVQQLVMQVRMVPVESVFMRFPRMVRDIAGKLGKQVQLEITGAETELDRTVVEALGDPLVHLVRNAMDHGLEGPDERVAAGKPAQGTLTIAAEHAGSEVLIEVLDDGRGIDPSRVGRIAVERGLIAADVAATLTVETAIELLFAPGFSTAEVATDLSGRGVGMDAVRTMVRNLGGDCTLVSEQGAGSRATIRLPLSLAILPALLVRASGAPYAIPLDRVEETIRLSGHAIRSVAGAQAIVLRDRVLPLVDLGDALGGSSVEPTNASAVVVRAGNDRIGLLVEHLIGQQELVTRPLPSLVEGDSTLVSGGAVMGDGSIALILNIESLRRTTLAA